MMTFSSKEGRKEMDDDARYRQEVLVQYPKMG